MLTQSNKMFNLVLILSVLLFKNGSCYEITSYARVSKNGGSISAKSDTANDPSSNYMSHIESTLIDKQNNVALKQQQLQEKEQQQQKTATSGNENVKEVEEKSEGRAIKSNYYFPLSDFLTKAKAMQSNSYKNEKEGRLIVYPSYTQNIDQTRRRYDMTPSTGQVAQRRFAPGEAYGVTGYKLKHPEKFPGYKYPQPNPVPQPQPQPIMMNSAPPRQPLPQPPMIMPTFNPPAASMMSDLPPSQHYLPPSKFLYPIIVADTTTESQVKAIKAPRATQPSHFLPTMPTEDETTSMNPIIDLLSFNKKVNTSYMPPELQAIKDSIDSNHVVIDDSHNNIDADTVATADLHRFPPNANSIYQPAVEMKRNNSINYKSRGSLEITTISNEDLHKFPPNADSAYLLPSNDVRNLEIINNRLPSPSGSKRNNINTVDRAKTSVPAIDLNKFPPNINSVYPPKATKNFVNLYNNYLAQASDRENNIRPIVRQASIDPSLDPVDLSEFPIKNNQKDASVAPEDLNKFPPNLDSDYLPPEVMTLMNLRNSYNPSASGEPKDAVISNPIMSEDTSVAPNDLQKFPPNLDSAYLPPEMMRIMNLFSSYLPPASGQDIENSSSTVQTQESSSDADVTQEDLHKFPPNLNAAYLPPEMMKFLNLYSSYLPPASGQETESNNNIDQQALTPGDDSSQNNNMMYLPPKDLNNFPPNINSNYLPPDMMNDLSLVNSYLPPASGNDLSLRPPPPDSSIPIPPTSSMMNQQAANGGMQMSQGYIYNKPTGGDMMMPPSGLIDMPPSGPPDDHEHDDHHHHHDHPWDSYPDIYYDDHDHHHHHHHVEETTTPAPLPVEPRVKKYSYYYLGRKLWYIPLYFTFWFCLYVAALIIRSIGRHKVDLPNHYVARSLHDMSHKEVVEKINKMTEFAMTQIDDFKNKYL